MELRFRATFVLIGMLVAGCATQQSALIRSVDFGIEDAFLTDARVRLINRIRPGVNSQLGIIDPRTVTCVEPSPDVAVAVANSFGIGISVLGQGSGSLTGQQVEGLAQIAERTTAIQALLKQGYQACLDYANGAINRTTYSLRTSRLDDLLVTLVLAEDATGAFGRSGAAIGTAARAEAQAKLASFPQAQEDLAKSRQDLNAAESKVIEKQAALDKANADLKAAPANSDTKALEQKVATAEAELKAAKAERDLLLNKLSEMTDTMSSAAGEVNRLISMGGLDASPDPRVAAVVGSMQERFIDKDIDQAFVSTCLVELGLTATEETLTMNEPVLDAARANAKEEGYATDAYFDAAVIAKNTELFKYCKNNLHGFLEQSSQRRHEFKMKRLDLEIKKLEALSGGAIATRLETAPAVYPLAAFTEAKAQAEGLTLKKDELTNVQPAASLPDAEKTKLTGEKTALLGRLTALLNLASTSTLSSGERASVETLEKERISLLGDPRRFGTTDQRAIWQAEFDLKEAQAREKHSLLRTLTNSLESMSRETDALLGRMKSTT